MTVPPSLLRSPAIQKYTALGKWLALISILLIGAFLRFNQLEYKSLWVDEIIQVVLASGSFFDTIAGMRSQPAAPPLDYLITWLMLQSGKNGVVTAEFVLRFPAVAAGILTIPFGYALAKRITRSVAAALVTAYLIALAPLLVRFAQEVRFYSLSVLTMVAMAYFFVRAYQQPTGRHWLVCGGAVLVAFFTHYYAGLVLAALVVFAAGTLALRLWHTRAALFTPAFRTRILIGAGASVLVVGVVSAWLMYASPYKMSGQYFAIPPLLEVIGEPLTSGHVGTKEHLLAVRVLGLVVFPALALLGLAFAVRAQKNGSVAMALVVVLGVGGVLVLDWAFQYFFTSRQLLFVVPFYVILIALGIVAPAKVLAQKSRILGILLGVSVLAGVTVPFAYSLRAYYDWPKDDWRVAARFLEHATASHPAVVITDPASLRGYLVYYAPSLARSFDGSETQSDASQAQADSRAWIVMQEGRQPGALEILRSNGWNTIRLNASPALHLVYAGPVPEKQLWQEAARLDVPAQILVYSSLLERAGECESDHTPLLAQARAALSPPTDPPLLDAQRSLLRRKLRRLC